MKIFTTGDVAKICGVCPKTANDWFDAGRLKGFRIPGSRARRVPRNHLIKFLKEHGMPYESVEDEMLAKVLMVSQDENYIKTLQILMTPACSFRLQVVSSGFDAGTLMNSFSPDAVIIDFDIGNEDAQSCLSSLQKNVTCTLNIILLTSGGGPIAHTVCGRIEGFKKPFDARLLTARLRTLIGERKDLCREPQILAIDPPP